MTAANAEVDVAVVGAGAAGLAAGTALAAAGASYVVLEARARIGGRAYTDTETFPGLPFDHGCHWLHCNHPAKAAGVDGRAQAAA